MININKIIEKLPSTAQLRMFGVAKIPLLFLVNPSIEKQDEKSCTVKIPLNYITRNHLRSMYFGTLAIGADSVVAVLALSIAKEFQDLKVIPIFKDFKAEFHQRAEGDVSFVCEAGDQIREMIREAKATQSRVTQSVEAKAFVRSQGEEPVASFTLGLSLKVKEY